MQLRPTPREKAPEPELGSTLIPKERYLSRDFMRLEWERLWTKVWVIAGLESDIPNPGDYFVHDVGHESIIVMRSAPGEIRAFYNVCPHRGNQFRAPGSGCGHAEQLQCSYHLWTFNIDGSLKHIPDMEDFPQGFPPEKRQLPGPLVDTWGGFVFINMDHNAESLADYLGVVTEHLAPYHFENWHIVEDYTWEWDCNWKVGCDSFNEVYHVQGIHPELLEFTDDVDCQVDLYGKHSRFLFKVGYPSPRWTDELARSRGYRDRFELTEPMKASMRSLGLNPETWESHDWEELRTALKAGKRTQSRAIGFDLEDLTDDQLLDDYHYFIFPNITLNISATHFWFFRHRLHPTDPNKMYWDFWTLVRLPEGAEAPPRAEHIDTKYGDGLEERLHLALQQDSASVAPVQRGMHSAGFEGLHISHQERRIRYMHRIIDDYLFGPDR